MGTKQKIFMPSPPRNLENDRFSFVIDRMYIGYVIKKKYLLWFCLVDNSKFNPTVLGLKNKSREKICTILKEMLWIHKNIINNIPKV